MILTITVNPALDVSAMVSKVVPDEKNYVTHETRSAGGNGINAARIAQRLGSKVLATGFLGGASGEELKGLLHGEEIPNKFIFIEGRTRTNVTISLKKGHQQTRLNFPGPKIWKAEVRSLQSFLLKLKPILVIIGGSLPFGVSSSDVKKMVVHFQRQSIPVFLDVPGPLLKSLLPSQPFFIKPNLTEFQEMTGEKLEGKIEVSRAAQKLSGRIPLICISSVDGGALLVSDKLAWFCKTPKLDVQSTIGAGDSMVGAMAHAFVTGHGSEAMLRLGMAAACATLSNKGLTMGSRSAVKKFLPLMIIEKIN
jgi:1-phosphofructokinase family hexose kinase